MFSFLKVTALVLLCTQCVHSVCLLTRQNVTCACVDDISQNCGEDWRVLYINNTENRPLVHLKRHSFKLCHSLEYIAIENSVNGLDPEAFCGLRNMQTIAFYRNRLAEIPNRVFYYVPVTTLIFKDNGIRELNEGCFRGPRHLKEIWLEGNMLWIVKTGIFHRPTLQKITIKDSSVSEIEDGAFNHLLKLHHLNLEGNKLSTFQAKKVLERGTPLNTISLANNQISMVTRLTFDGLSQLEEINLNGNRIYSIEVGTFSGTKNLRALYLNNNQLQNIEYLAFPAGGLPKLHQLHIRFNLFSNISLSIPSMFINLKELCIGGNPWLCPCYNVIYSWSAAHNTLCPDDLEYNNGKKPICVVYGSNTKYCNFNTENTNRSDTLITRYIRSPVH